MPLQQITKLQRQAIMKISVCHINITSITKHKDELLANFSTYDIISVNETNLKGERSFSLKGYNIFRNDRVGKSGGGVLLAVKDHIKCSEILNETIGDNEIVAIELHTKPLSKTSIFCINLCTIKSKNMS